MAVNIKPLSIVIISAIALTTLLFNSLPSMAQEYDEEDSSVSSWYQRQAKYHQRQASEYEKQAQFDREMNEYDTDEPEDKNNFLSQEDSSVNDPSEIQSADVFRE
jgi:hypothetical protein